MTFIIFDEVIYRATSPLTDPTAMVKLLLKFLRLAFSVFKVKVSFTKSRDTNSCKLQLHQEHNLVSTTSMFAFFFPWNARRTQQISVLIRGNRVYNPFLALTVQIQCFESTIDVSVLRNHKTIDILI